MPLVLADRVVERSDTKGLANFTLQGTSTGYQAFSAVGNGSTVYYTIEGVYDDGTLTGEWEVGVGVYNAGILSRDTILSSSTGSKVSFTAGQKNVFIDLPSEKAVVLDDTDKVSGYAITGGSINNTPIGATTASTGKFTILESTGQADLGTASTNYISLRGASGAPTIRTISASTAGLGLSSSGSGAINFYTNSVLQEQMRVAHTASAVNYVQVTGAATGSAPILSTQGSDTTIPFYIRAKGTTFIYLQNATGTTQFSTGGTSVAVNYLNARGNASGNGAALESVGSDTNIAMQLLSKGTGAIDLAAGSSGVNISNGGTVTAITRTAQGASYTSAPTVTISAPTTAGGVQATAQARMFVWSNPITTAGTGYTVGNTLTAIGGTGTAYSFTVTSINGSGGITGVNIVNFGDYTVVPTSPVTFSGGTGTGFTSNMTWTVGSTFNITNAGSGYIEQPTVTFSGGGGSGAAAYATVGSATTIRSLAGASGASMSFFTPAGEVLRLHDVGGTTANFLRFQGGVAGNTPVMLASGSDTNVTMALRTQGTGSISFQTGGVTQALVSHTASAVNYVQVTGAATTAAPVLSAQGSDTNIPLNVWTKGNQAFNFLTNGGAQRQFRITHTTSAVNFGYVTGGAAGAAVTFGVDALSSDTNIDLSLTTKGTGALNVNTGSGIAFKVADIGTASSAYWTAYGGTNTPEFRAFGGGSAVISLASANSIQFRTNTSNEQFRVSNTASAVNYVQVTGNVTNTSPIISAQGSDANIALSITSKGTNAIRFLSNNATNLQFRIAGTNAAVNNLAVTGTTAGNAPILSAEGSDTNIDLALTPKGTGLVRFGTYTNTVSTIAGYIEIRDAGGTIRRLAVVS
jgi:hypothetical protein